MTKLLVVLSALMLAAGFVLFTGSGKSTVTAQPDPPPPDAHYFKCYRAGLAREGPAFQQQTVQLNDEWRWFEEGSKTWRVIGPNAFCSVLEEPILGVGAEAAGDGTSHLVCYGIRPVSGQTFERAEDQIFLNIFTDQSGQRLHLDVSRPATLCAPSLKGLTSQPPFGDLLFKCYRARTSDGAAQEKPVFIDDDQTPGKNAVVRRVTQVCVPVSKKYVGGVEAGTGEAAGLGGFMICYSIRQELPLITINAAGFSFLQSLTRFEDINNQFGPQTLVVRRAISLCVPSVKWD